VRHKIKAPRSSNAGYESRARAVDGVGSSVSDLASTRRVFGTSLLSTTFGALLVAPAWCEQPPSPQGANSASQAAANATAGDRVAPAKLIPTPTEDVSRQLQALIEAPYPPSLTSDPETPDEWMALGNLRAQPLLAALPGLKEELCVTVEPSTVAGVKVFIVTPKAIPPANQNRLLVHLHAYGWLFMPGESGATEAVLMAGFGGFKVISIDYRTLPEGPYPAALDDAVAVWKELVKTAKPQNMALFGTSTGGNLTLAMVLRAKDEKLPLPAAIAPNAPWADQGKIGDSYNTNEWVDNVLVTWDSWLGRAAKLYANGHGLKEPYISPIYGDFTNFPPTILTSGTRDLFLSNVVRTHRKLKHAGVVAELNVYEGMSHAQFQDVRFTPESQEVYTDIAKFFDRYLER
jgi:epsilon-lactone hydrolase